MKVQGVTAAPSQRQDTADPPSRPPGRPGSGQPCHHRVRALLAQKGVVPAPASLGDEGGATLGFQGCGRRMGLPDPRSECGSDPKMAKGLQTSESLIVTHVTDRLG